MSTAKHLKIPDDAISRTHIDQSIDELLKRVTICRDYWIPYLAGYNTEWKDHPVVFIDPRLPEKLTYDNETIPVTRYLIIHESVEKCLMNELGMPYILAHNLATAAEKTACEADGYSWYAYTLALKPYIKMVEKKADVDSPSDLDKTPYIQEKAPMLSQMA